MSEHEKNEDSENVDSYTIEWNKIRRERLSYTKDFAIILARTTRYTTFGLLNPMQGFRSLASAGKEFRAGLVSGWTTATAEMEYLQNRATKAKMERVAQAAADEEAMDEQLAKFVAASQAATTG